jgi:hypothetical protein
MEEIILPFKLSPDKNTKAVSELEFTVQRQQSQFSTVSVSRLRFMKLYEEERYSLNQYPLNSESWCDYKEALDLFRANISSGAVPQRNDLHFGHARNPELKALDQLPHYIEIDIVRSEHRTDRTSLERSAQGEYQTVNPSKEQLKEDNTKIQSLLICDTDLRHAGYGGWEGVLKCDMQNLGFVRVRHQGLGNTFKVRASMYNFLGQALSEMPSIQLSLLFR